MKIRVNMSNEEEKFLGKAFKVYGIIFAVAIVVLSTLAMF